MADRDEVLERLRRIYKSVIRDHGYENCYLTGSMAIYLLCKQLEIDVGNFVPRDVDILVTSPRLKNHQGVSSDTYNLGEDEYDLIVQRAKVYGIEVRGFEDIPRIIVQNPKRILELYEEELREKEEMEQLDLVEKENIERKIYLLQQIQETIQNRGIQYKKVPEPRRRERERKEKRSRDRVTKTLIF